jgi:hypothetical protein
MCRFTQREQPASRSEKNAREAKGINAERQPVQAQQTCASAPDHLRRTRVVEDRAAASDGTLCGDEKRRRGGGSETLGRCTATWRAGASDDALCGDEMRRCGGGCGTLGRCSAT